MAISANVNNGMITDQSNADKALQSQGTGRVAAKDKAKKKEAEFDKEMFLKLLAAEMQYQDPMEPTKNSEYVTEMATFSQVEATQNVSSSVDNISTANIVGKYVTVVTQEDSTTGIVDYYTKKDDGIYVSINDKEYSIDDVVSVKDSEYYEATIAASSVSSLLSKVPSADNFTLENEEDFVTAKTLFDSLSTYAKQFVSKEDANKIFEITNKLAALKNA